MGISASSTGGGARASFRGNLDYAPPATCLLLISAFEVSAFSIECGIVKSRSSPLEKAKRNSARIENRLRPVFPVPLLRQHAVVDKKSALE